MTMTRSRLSKTAERSTLTIPSFLIGESSLALITSESLTNVSCVSIVNIAISFSG